MSEFVLQLRGFYFALISSIFIFMVLKFDFINFQQLAKDFLKIKCDKNKVTLLLFYILILCSNSDSYDTKAPDYSCNHLL